MSHGKVFEKFDRRFESQHQAMSLATATSAASLALITPSLTTTFMPKITACTENRVTMLANRAFQIWMNAPVPVPGTTFTDCYPSQFITSLLLSAGSVTQPAFAPLICPKHYSAVGPYTSNYIACCPRYVYFNKYPKCWILISQRVLVRAARKYSVH